MPREDLSEQDNRRWAEIIELAINLKLATDLIERMLRKVQQQKTSQRREFSQTGLEELTGLQEQLLANLRLGLSVFLSADPESARCCARNAASAQERRLAHAHVSRLQRKSCRVSRPVRYTWS
jgi:phosphate:Na+ symporter